MDKKIVFIEEDESFIVRSIIKSLEGLGLECMKLNWSIEKIAAQKADFSDFIIAYIDDADDVDLQALIYLRDLCIEENHGLYLAGYEDDIADLKKKSSISQVAGEYHRPINAIEVAEQICQMVTDNPMMHKKHVLVVDDSGTMLNTMKEWLGDRYRVSVVNSAMNAIAFLSKSIPDLILLDYEMPGCSGPQLLEMLRADARTDTIPVIFLTGNNDPESVKKVLALKPMGYLLKSMPQQDIISRIDNFFIKQKSL